MQRISFILATVMAVILAGPISQALAGDKEDLETRIVKYHEVWNAKDAVAFAEYFSSTGTVLANPNGLFSEKDVIDGTGVAAFEGQFNFIPRYIQVSIYGNGTVGAVNYYRMGNTTNAEGVTFPVRLRVSEVWIKERGQWRAVHRHLSPFRIGAQNN